MRISYTSHTNLKMEISQFLSLFRMNLSKVSHISKIIVESKYVIKCLTYLAEVVNYDTFNDVIRLKLGKGTTYIFRPQIELQA